MDCSAWPEEHGHYSQRHDLLPAVVPCGGTCGKLITRATAHQPSVGVYKCCACVGCSNGQADGTSQEFVPVIAVQPKVATTMAAAK